MVIVVNGQNMEQLFKEIFYLEESLSQKDSPAFISHLKEIVSTSHQTRIDLTRNPGLTIYTPFPSKKSTKKANILIIIHELSRTGAPVVAIDTAKTLKKMGYFVTVLSMRRGLLLTELLDNGIPVIYDRELALVHDSEELLGNPKANLHIDTILNAFDKAIVITAVYYNLICRCGNIKTPVLWWLHEGSATYEYLAPLMPSRLPKHVTVYTGGQYALDQLHAHNLMYPAKILNYGVEDIYIPHPKHPDNHKPTVFILPGSIGKRKGQQTLLDAISLLPNSYLEKSKFIFIGDITSEYDIEGKRTKKNLINISRSQKNIEYHTSVSRKRLFEIYEDIDVLVLPSIDDPMPVVATEALMLKKIVLCSNCTGTSYYLTDTENGFIFESQNIAALCDKIKYIIDHKHNLKNIGEKGRKVYEKHFEMKRFEKNILSIIEELT